MHLPLNRRNSFPVAMAAAMAAALFVTGCETNSPPPAVAASAVPASAPSPAAAPAPSAPDAKSFSTSGPLVAEQQADVGVERDGRIIEVAVQIGDHVRAGQLLAQLDDRMLQAALAAQKAHMAAAAAEVRNWKAEQESAHADLRRADALLKENILSQESWEVSKYKADETMAQVERYESEQTAAEAEAHVVRHGLGEHFFERFIGLSGAVAGRGAAVDLGARNTRCNAG